VFWVHPLPLLIHLHSKEATQYSLVSVNEVMAYVGEKKENESEIGFLD
jgi:hypothetical protein